MKKFRPGFMTLRAWTRHSVVLSVAGFVYVLYGFTFFYGLSRTREEQIHIALHWFHAPFWGVCFLVTGLAALISTRWPPASSEIWGYDALTFMAALWALVYFFGIFRDPAGVPGVLIWSLIAFLWWAISGLRNPSNRILGRRH